jgi:hypothetical protein
MNEHLLPEQIDLLVDGAAGFTARPMRQHLAACDACRARVDEVRRAAERLERLPHFAPSGAFAQRVMGQVQVITPWHVALTDALAEALPARGPARALGIAALALTSLGVTAAGLWLALRWDLASWMLDLGFERGRAGVVEGARAAAAALLGTDLAGSLNGGGFLTIAVASGALGLAALAAAAGLRRLLGTARANRG